MKISVTLSILILSVAAGIVWNDPRRLDTLRTSQARLIASAAKLGISLDPAHPTTVRITHRKRENRKVDAKALAARFISYAKEMMARGQTDAANKKRHLEMMELVMTSDGAGLRILPAVLQGASDFEIPMRQRSVAFAIMMLSHEHPELALTLITE